MESVDKSEMNNINLTLGMNQRRNDVERSIKICDCRIKFNESMLMGTELISNGVRRTHA
jgi:hypothetical protein